MMWNRRRIALAALTGAAAVAAGVSAFLLTGHGPPAPRDTPAAAPATPTPRRLLSPFTGEPVKYLARELIVKIGNTVPERPATGLAKADLVYMIPVEGGLSRIMAVFSSHYPRVIGPVRSAREDDLALLRQFGRPAFAFSGATYRLLPVVERARIVNLYAGTAAGYFRGTNRIAPYNLYARTRTLLAQARHASTARNIGFRFGPPPPGGRSTRSAHVCYPAACFRFTWSAAKGRWLVWMDGARAYSTGAGQLSAPTVVIEYTIVRTSRFKEYGKRPPYAESTGSGPDVVLRNGRAYHGRWWRPHAGGGTVFATFNGKPMNFARGPVWIILTARGRNWARAGI